MLLISFRHQEEILEDVSYCDASHPISYRVELKITPINSCAGTAGSLT